jgi:hypothetical protein
MFTLFSLQFQTVSREIRKILTERARNFSIALDDVSITSLSFGKEFTHAIEAKQVAAQEAERAKFIVEKAEQDKRSAIIRAQVRKQFLVKCDNLTKLVCISSAEPSSETQPVFAVNRERPSLRS